MGFVPENRLEQAMLDAATRAAARPDFYRLLMESELIALGEVGVQISIDTVMNKGRQCHPVFTSERRLREFLHQPMASFRMQARMLFDCTRGASFVLNPGAELSKILEPDEIAYWLQRVRMEFPNFIVAQPKVYPRKLVRALCVLFTSRSLITDAHLAYVAREGVDKEAHPMIGLEAEDDVPRLASEIFAAAAVALPGTPVDVVYLDPSRPLTPLQQHLLKLPPFYKRTVTLN